MSLYRLVGLIFCKGELMNIKRIFHNKTGNFMTCAAVAGIIATSVLCIEATPKAMKLIAEAEEGSDEPLTTKEKIVAAAPVYIPAACMGIGTIMCVISMNMISYNTQKTLAGMYVLSDQSFKNYRDKLIELKGEEADKEIRDAVVREYGDFHQLGIDIPDTKMTWIEPYTGRTFEAYEREVMDAEYHINRNYILRGYVTVNEYLEFLGLDSAGEEEDYIGWEMAGGIYWIDFMHEIKGHGKNRHCELQYIYGPDNLIETFDEA